MPTRTQVKYHIYRWFWLIQKRGQLMYAKIGVTVKFSTHLPSRIPQPPQTCWSLIYALRSLSHTHIIHFSQCTSNSLYKIGLYTNTHIIIWAQTFTSNTRCVSHALSTVCCMFFDIRKFYKARKKYNILYDTVLLKRPTFSSGTFTGRWYRMRKPGVTRQMRLCALTIQRETLRSISC